MSASFAALCNVTTREPKAEQELLRTKGAQAMNQSHKTHGRSSVSGSSQKGKGHTREGPERHLMLVPHKRARVHNV